MFQANDLTSFGNGLKAAAVNQREGILEPAGLDTVDELLRGVTGDTGIPATEGKVEMDLFAVVTQGARCGEDQDDSERQDDILLRPAPPRPREVSLLFHEIIAAVLNGAAAVRWTPRIP